MMENNVENTDTKSQTPPTPDLRQENNHLKHEIEFLKIHIVKLYETCSQLASKISNSYYHNEILQKYQKNTEFLKGQLLQASQIIRHLEAVNKDLQEKSSIAQQFKECPENLQNENLEARHFKSEVTVMLNQYLRKGEPDGSSSTQNPV